MSGTVTPKPDDDFKYYQRVADGKTTPKDPKMDGITKKQLAAHDESPKKASLFGKITAGFDATKKLRTEVEQLAGKLDAQAGQDGFRTNNVSFFRAFMNTHPTLSKKELKELRDEMSAALKNPDSIRPTIIQEGGAPIAKLKTIQDVIAVLQRMKSSS